MWRVWLWQLRKCVILTLFRGIVCYFHVLGFQRCSENWVASSFIIQLNLHQQYHPYHLYFTKRNFNFQFMKLETKQKVEINFKFVCARWNMCFFWKLRIWWWIIIKSWSKNILFVDYGREQAQKSQSKVNIEHEIYFDVLIPFFGIFEFWIFIFNVEVFCFQCCSSQVILWIWLKSSKRFKNNFK